MSNTRPLTCRAPDTEHRCWVRERRVARLTPASHSVATCPIQVRMRDGTMLSAKLHRPLGPERFPGILIANGYGDAGEVALAGTIGLLAKHGYVVLCARMRGLRPSEGRTGLYEGFGADSYDLIEWLARQPECIGRVGMVGSSLLGLVQYLAAREAPPSLKVILPDDAGSDNYWYLWHPGGMNAGPGRAARQSVSGAESEYPLAVAHPNFDCFWRERTLQPADFEAIANRGVSVFLTSGWDSYMLGSTKSYEWLRKGNPGARLKMFVGPWSHGTFMSPEPPSGGPPVLPYTGFEYGLMWLDRWLKGITNNIADEPPVLIYVQGPDEWRFEHDWPLPDERRVRLYLREERSGTRGGLNDGVLSVRPPGEDASVTYHYSPDGPYNQAAVNAFSRPRIDKSSYEAHGLAWTSELLSAATEMTGYPKISFWCSLSSTDTDFVLEISDVDPHARPHTLQSVQVTRGYLNAMRHFSRSDPKPLTSGKPYRFELELYPTSYVFPAGHRIRLTLQGSAIDPSVTPAVQQVPEYPDADPLLLTLAQGPGLHSQEASVTVIQYAAHPSFIELPIIGGNSGMT